MNRTYKIEPDSVSFIEWHKYKNPYKGARPRIKGTYYTGVYFIKLVLGVLWKYCRQGGRS